VSFDKTVVTACDSNYLWGALLLGASLRYFKLPVAFHVLGYDLKPLHVKILEQLGDTKVIVVPKDDTRSVCTQKPRAIFTADTETIIWMDADCIVTGDVSKYLVTPDGKFQIRFRSEEENAMVYRNLYTASDRVGNIPTKVLAEWQNDVADKESSQINTVSETNCFVLNKSHLPFIQLWQDQMMKVIPADTKGVYNKNSIGYSMTDESTINSLFAYSSEAPVVAEYQLDKDPDAFLAHFGLPPKPWVKWSKNNLRYYDLVIDLVKWMQDAQFILPPIPDALDIKKKKVAFLEAEFIHHYKMTRYRVSTLVRSLLRHLKS